MSFFKKYLHVDRNIQKELLELINEANNSEQSQLVLLCGSVGDGKSHLLAYVNEEYKEIISNFKIHNDATESFDPSQTEIETLKKVNKQLICKLDRYDAIVDERDELRNNLGHLQYLTKKILD